MTGGIRRSLAFVTAALMSTAAFTGSAMSIQPRAEAPRKQHIPSRRSYGYSFNYGKGPGWSFAQVKRMAKKRRNKLRHRRACRG